MMATALPPDLHSAHMYTGPGVGSMLAAVAVTDQLAADREATVISPIPYHKLALIHLFVRPTSESRPELPTLRIRPEAVG